ncbi:uncharacterized protein HMPREF1541_00653 [Cyphellophora europaea CBS 101466]|uniref:Zn(2)-C6 fungal-type domain-containing protein n=1 Tax=Cyphellophora europaea (strain CBS 101466) TaxID=1220924 RepID=W2SEM3_CYPE1|nr:uncharacterized protein HMPREF1541_00653 [Cyphellophora europaea CBS 101466]ETN46468.1 hypothetical protein HMPREF1541_00653 [Cyphellophora europaea CBS 101466]
MTVHVSAPIRPSHDVAQSVVVQEKSRWLNGLVKKAKHPKVRSGCSTCKQRRLKCDENKPYCLRCIKSSRECAGYSQLRASAPVRTPARETEHQSITDQDHEILHHFIREAADQLSGFSLSLREFCQCLAPQMGHEYPAVKYALFSIAARTQAAAFRWNGHRSRAEAMAQKSNALVHYNNSIHCLTAAAAKVVPPEVFLVCGLLFAATEHWPHRDMAPTVHILTAFKLVLRGTSLLPEEVKQAMFPFLVHMGRKALAFSDDIPEHLASEMRSFVWINIGPPQIPTAYTSLKEVWSLMDTLLNFVAAFSPNDPTFNFEARPSLLKYASELQRSIMETTEQLRDAGHGLNMECRALLMHHRTLQVMFDVNQVDNESIYDLFTPDFEHILYECEAICQEGSSMKEYKGKPWHATLGILAPLFIVATRCRIARLRHRAIKALHSSRRRERQWNSCIATMLARFVVHTEEKNRQPGQTGPLSELYRIRLDSVVFDRDAERIYVTYTNPTTSEIGQALLSWKPRDNIDDDFECVAISRKNLHASGYGGIMLVTPPIQCQCGNDDYTAR